MNIAATSLNTGETITVKETPVLETSLQRTTYCGCTQHVLWGRMTLYETRLVLRGWTLRGRIERSWSLQEVRDVVWVRKPGADLMLKLHNGTRYFIKARGAGVWWYVLGAYLEGRKPS